MPPKSPGGRRSVPPRSSEYRSGARCTTVLPRGSEPAFLPVRAGRKLEDEASPGAQEPRRRYANGECARGLPARATRGTGRLTPDRQLEVTFAAMQLQPGAGADRTKANPGREASRATSLRGTPGQNIRSCSLAPRVNCSVESGEGSAARPAFRQAIRNSDSRLAAIAPSPRFRVPNRGL